jgi:hypothetical protein
MTLPLSTLLWVVVPPLFLIVVTVVWSVKHWDRTP